MKFQLERLALFSDAVFAIAITLMIIEIKPPRIEHGISFGRALEEFSEVLPSFFGTVLSFFLIGMFWKRHHELMKYMVAYDQKVIYMNLALLLSLAFIPFSTAFVFENTQAVSPLPLLLYNINYIIATILNYRLSAYILNPQNKLRSEHYDGDITFFKREMRFQVVVYALVAVLAFINPNLAPIGYPLLAFEDKWAKWKKVAKN